MQITSNKGGITQSLVATSILTSPIPQTQILTAQNLIGTVPTGNTLIIPVPNAGVAGNLIHILTAPAQGTATIGTDTITYVARPNTGTRIDTFTYNLTANCVAPCTPVAVRL